MSRTEKTTMEQRSEGIAELEAVLTRSQPSVLIKRDGKGVLSYEVKAYADEMIEALNEAVAAVRQLEGLEAGGAFDMKSPNGPVPKPINQHLVDKDEV